MNLLMLQIGCHTGPVIFFAGPQNICAGLSPGLPGLRMVENGKQKDQ